MNGERQLPQGENLPFELPEGLTSEEVLELLDSGWGFPMDIVQDWFENFWNSVQEWVYDAARSLTDFLSDVGSEFWKLLLGWFGSLTGTITSWVKWLKDEISLGLEWLLGEIKEVLTFVNTSLGGVWDTAKATAGDVFSSIGETLQGWIASISTFFQQGVNYLGNYINEIADWLGAKVTEVGTTIREQIADPITDFFMDLPERIGAIFEPIIDPFRFAYQFWVWFFQGNPGERVAYGLSQSFQWVSEKVSPYIEDAIDSLIGFIEKQAPMSPAKSMGTAKGLLTLGGLSVGGLAAMTIAGEIMHPLKQMGMGHIAAMIGDVVNYRMISGLIIGALLTSGVRTPLNYYINSLLRPWLMDRRDFMELMSRRAFTEPEVLMEPDHAARFKAAMGKPGGEWEADMIGYYGYPAEYHAFFKELANTRIGYFALAAVARDGTFDWDWFTESLHRAGYAERVVVNLRDMYERVSKEGQRGQFASTAFRRYREGVTEIEGFEQELVVLGYGEDKRPGYIVGAGLDRETDDILARVSAYKSLLRRGKILPEDFRKGLTELGISTLKIDIYMDEARIYRGLDFAPEQEDTLKGRYASIVVRLYKEGFRKPDEFRTTLETLSYTGVDIDQLQLRAELEYELDWKLDLLAAYRDRFRKDAITEAQYRGALRYLDMRPDRVILEVNKELIRKFTPEE